MRAWATALVALLGSGCGLVLDLSPADPDAGGGFDAGRASDAGRRDGGARDAGPSMDAGDARDGGMERPDGRVPPIDASRLDATVFPDDGGLIDRCEDVCTADGFYCERPDGRCIGPARCVPIPPTTSCPDVVACGCDHRTYATPCAARAAGVNVATIGDCPDFTSLDWCDLPEPPMGPTWGCHPCFDEDDCLDIPLTTEWVCVGSACTAGGEGSCQPAGSPSDCFYDPECPVGETCVAPEIRTCVGSEFLSQGSCR